MPYIDYLELPQHIFNAAYNNDANQLKQLLTERARLIKAGRTNYPSLNALYVDESLVHLGYTQYSLLSIAVVLGNRAVIELLLSNDKTLLLNEINFKSVDENGKTIIDIVLEQDEATQLIFIEAAIKKQSPVIEEYLKKNNLNCAMVVKAAINLILNNDFSIKLTDAKYYIDVIAKTVERFPQRRKSINEKLVDLSPEEKAIISVLIAKFAFKHVKEFHELLDIKNNLKLVFKVWEKFTDFKSKYHFKDLLSVVISKPRSSSASEADAKSNAKLNVKEVSTDTVAMWYGNPANIDFTRNHAKLVQAAIPLAKLPPAQLPPSAAIPVLVKG